METLLVSIVKSATVARLSFSPLAGIKYVETLLKLFSKPIPCFSPLAGIKYVETLATAVVVDRIALMFQSPCGD